MFTPGFNMRIACVLILACRAWFASAQETSNVKFGKITPGDFNASKYSVADSNTGAIIIADIGSTTFVGNDYNWLSHVYKKYTRIKILNQNGFEAATQKILLYSREEATEQLSDINAVTYNLEDGKIVETRLTKTDIFDDRLSKHYVEKKFTLPGVKAGSIIEYSYTVRSDFDFRLHEWEFQSPYYPCLWSEYQVSIPNLLIYASIRQGFDSFYISKFWQTNESYSISEQSDKQILVRPPGKILNTIVNNYRWVIKDVQPLKVESYISSPLNYVDKIEFQLYQVSNGESTTDVVTNWKTAVHELLTDKNFGDEIDDNSPYWLKDKIKELTGDSPDQKEFAERAFAFCRDNFSCNSYSNFFIKTTLKDAFDSKNGNVGELNLILLLLLRHQGIAADPVLLSTRDYGVNFSTYPVIDKFNYLICRAKIGDNIYYLDCSHPLLGFGLLPNSCYNGKAWIITTAEPDSTFLSADSVKEQTTTLATITSDESGNLSGTCRIVEGIFKSFDIRKKINADKTADYKKLFKDDLPTGLGVSDISVDSLKNPSAPATLRYDFSLQTAGEETFYFNPFTENVIKNPFTALQRVYPVEIPHCIQDVYILNMQIPAGYKVDELPKSVRMKLGESDGYFEYIAVASNDHIQLRCSTVVNRANFDADYYQVLRDFFALVVKKQSEQIVFKKIK